LEKDRLANPKKEGVDIWRSTDGLIKEGVDIWRSTDGQTPKKEGVDI